MAVTIVLLGLAGIAAALSDSAKVGKWFAIGLAAALCVLLLLARITLRLLRYALSRTRLRYLRRCVMDSLTFIVPATSQRLCSLR